MEWIRGSRWPVTTVFRNHSIRTVKYRRYLVTGIGNNYLPIPGIGIIRGLNTTLWYVVWNNSSTLRLRNFPQIPQSSRSNDDAGRQHIQVLRVSPHPTQTVVGHAVVLKDDTPARATVVRSTVVHVYRSLSLPATHNLFYKWITVWLINGLVARRVHPKSIWRTEITQKSYSSTKNFWSV